MFVCVRLQLSWAPVLACSVRAAPLPLAVASPFSEAIPQEELGSGAGRRGPLAGCPFLWAVGGVLATAPGDPGVGRLWMAARVPARSVAARDARVPPCLPRWELEGQPHAWQGRQASPGVRLQGPLGFPRAESGRLAGRLLLRGRPFPPSCRPVLEGRGCRCQTRASLWAGV